MPVDEMFIEVQICIHYNKIMGIAEPMISLALHVFDKISSEKWSIISYLCLRFIASVLEFTFTYPVLGFMHLSTANLMTGSNQVIQNTIKGGHFFRYGRLECYRFLQPILQNRSPIRILRCLLFSWYNLKDYVALLVDHYT